jgi:hypothetical protein
VGINWGDVPTWLAVGVGAIGGGAALFQLHQQSNVLKGEVERNKRRDELLDGQLRDLERRARLAERQQANRVLVVVEEWVGAYTGAVPEESDAPGYVAAVANESNRPIRRVAARLHVGGEGTKLPTRVGRFADRYFPFGGSQLKFNTWSDGSCADLVRVGENVGFAFPSEVDRGLDARVSVRFTDDAGLHWEVDHDLSLTRLDDRDDW